VLCVLCSSEGLLGSLSAFPTPSRATMAAAALHRHAAMLRGPGTVTGAAWMGRVAQVLRVQDKAMAMLQLHSPLLSSEAVRIMRQEVDESQEDERVHSMAIRPVAPCIAGSDVAALHADTAESRSDHFDSIAHLCRALGESQVPVVAMLDGNLQGPALGLAAHARFSVVTDRTRLLLAGPEFGFVPESFATHQLARLPSGLGAYLCLTGAALGGAELKELGLATHYTEAQALERLEVEMGLQPERSARQLEGILDDACLAPPATPLEVTRRHTEPRP
jgi:enoyl-CoA hydratase/carnithine racemase